MDIHDLSLFRRMLCSLSPYPFVVGESSDVPLDQCWVVRPQLFSLAICGPGAHGCRAGPITPTARTTSESNSCSTAPSSPWSCPGAALWKLWACRSCMSPHSRQFCVWASAPPRRRCAGARALDSPLPPRQLYSDHPTPLPPKMQPMSRARREATCTRSTNGCGSLSGANRVWGGLSVAETEERRIAVAKDGAKRAVVTRARRSRKHWRIPPPRTDMGGQ